MKAVGVVAAVLVAVCARVVAADGEGGVATFSLEEIALDEAAGDVRRALVEEGMLAIRGVPGLAAARKEALLDTALCVPRHEGHIKRTLEDGTARMSVGTESQVALLGELAASKAVKECAGFADSSIRLRRAVQLATHAFTARLAAILGQPTADGVRAGSVLEHFHVYQRVAESTKRDGRSRDGTSASSAAASAAALRLHTDAGLFIAFVPALLVHQDGTLAGPSSTSAGFRYETSRGALVSPVFQDDGDVVVFMVGDGFNQVFGGLASLPLRPVPHELSLPPSDALRAWYGAMVLPASETVLPGGRAFEDVRREQIQAARAAGTALSSVGCSAPSLAASDLSGGCSEPGEVYCWLQCVKPAQFGGPCPKGTSALCLHPDHSVWTPEQSHCMDCKVECVPDAPAPTPLPTSEPPQPGASNSFCNGFVTNMYMDGFTGVGDPDTACLVLLFNQLRLDSPLRFALGLVAVFVFGLVVELVVRVRRAFERRARRTKPTWRIRFQRALLYMLQLVMGYVAMLVAMTYSPFMFAAIVLGLGAGHLLFNSTQPVQESAEPCCAAMDDDEFIEQTAPSSRGNTAPLLA